MHCQEESRSDGPQGKEDSKMIPRFRIWVPVPRRGKTREDTCRRTSCSLFPPPSTRPIAHFGHTFSLMPESQNLQRRKVLTEDVVNACPLCTTEVLSRSLKGQTGPQPPQLANLGWRRSPRDVTPGSVSDEPGSQIIISECHQFKACVCLKQ